MAFINQQGRTMTSLSEINFIPLIDVMLVLLIIFMVAAPMMQTGIDVNLPETRNVRVSSQENRIIISISRQGDLYYGPEAINFADLPERLKKDAKGQQDAIFVRGDKDIRWDIMVSVIDAVRGAGFSNVQLVTRPWDGPAAKKR